MIIYLENLEIFKLFNPVQKEMIKNGSKMEN